MNQTRRAVLKAGGGLTAAGSLAGCLSNPFDGSGGEATGYANFFALWDWAENVAGDEFSFENPVDTGSMGHGWSPDGDITREIASSELFVYLDTPEFSWAQDVASELRADYENVHVVDGMRGLEPYLIPFNADPIPEPDHGREYPEESLRLVEWDIIDLRADQRLGYWHTEHWHGGIPDVELDDSVPVGIVLQDNDDYVVPLGDDEEYQVDARIADGEDESVVEIESHGDHVEFHGRELGTTAAIFEIRRGDELIYDTADEPSSFEVVDSIEGEGAEDFHDPHVWADPVLAQRVVGRIADELADLDPENAETYQANAESYAERLEGVHEQFETVVEEAELDIAIFAAHDSFQYVERRYEFELHTPTGISPDANVSPSDIGDMLELIEQHDIDTVLYDPFESANPGEEVPQMVQTIFENSDVENAEPLTPVEGTTAEWADNGWGWIEQMEELNLPSLRAALNA